MSLFRAVPKSSERRRANEPFIDFLSRFDNPVAEFTRKEIEEWFGRFPSDHQQELASKIRQADAMQFHAGVFELFIFEVLNRLGLHPTIVPRAAGPTHDFDISDGNQSVMVEATITSDAPNGEWARLGDLRAAIASLRSQDVVVRVLRRGKIPVDLKAKTVRFELNRFADSSDVSEYVRRARNNESCKPPVYRIPFNGGELLFEFRARLSAGPENPTALLDWFDGPLDLATDTSIRNALDRKASKYGQPQTPFVIALNVFGDRLVDETDIVNALYGKGASESILGRRDGFWNPGRSTRVSAVLVSRGVVPAVNHESELELYLNPWATHPLAGPGLLALPQVVLVGDRLEKKPGLPPADLFKSGLDLGG